MLEGLQQESPIPCQMTTGTGSAPWVNPHTDNKPDKYILVHKQFPRCLCW